MLTARASRPSAHERPVAVFDAIALLWLAAIPLVASPGPATLSLAAMGSAFGARASLGYLVGVLLGSMLVMAGIVLGLAGAVAVVPGLMPVLSVVAAVYLLYLAWRIATAPPLGTPRGHTRAPSVRGGVLLALANPKAYAVFSALLAGHTVLPRDTVGDAAVKVAALMALLVVVDLAWALAGSALSRLLHRPRLSRAINIAFAILLVASVGLILAQ